MNAPHNSSRAKAREIVTQNVQKGELYRIMFTGDPETYTGMPIAPPGTPAEYDDLFEIKVVEPAHKAGIMRRSIDEVCWLEKCK